MSVLDFLNSIAATYGLTPSDEAEIARCYERITYARDLADSDARSQGKMVCRHGEFVAVAK